MNSLSRKLVTGGFYAIAFIAFLSCSKTKNQNSADANLKLSSERVLTQEQIDEIGALHNQYLETVVSNLDFSSNSLTDDIVEEFNKLNIEVHTFELLPNHGNIPALKEELYKSVSAEAINLIEQAVGYSEEYTTVSDYQSFVNDLESQAHVELSGSELDVVLVTFSVLKNSAYFWSPAEMGGSGVGHAALVQYHGTLNKAAGPSFSFRKAMIGDGISGGIGCLGVAAAGLLGPIGWGALAICAGEAAISSGIAGFM